MTRVAHPQDWVVGQRKENKPNSKPTALSESDRKGPRYKAMHNEKIRTNKS